MEEITSVWPVWQESMARGEEATWR